MVVCPECRSDNPEEAKFCTRCGQSLIATESTIRRVVRREGVEEGIDIPTPKLPSPLFGIAVIAALLVATVGVGVWYFLRPNPCAGKLSSSQFPYCVTLPTGWEQATEEISGQQADAYSAPSGDAVVLVVAEQVEPGVKTTAYAETHRTREESGGLFPGPVEELAVGGQDAVSWEVTATIENGTVVHQLRVALVQGQTGWVITFVGNEESYGRDRDLFHQILRSWSFT
jgi:zinc ribbon protein